MIQPPKSSKPAARLRVLLVDDHPMFREGLRSCLGAVAQIEIVGEAADGETALQGMRRHRPDLVLVDLNLPGMGGLQTTAAIRRQCPRVRVVILTMHHQREYIVEAIKAGAHGFVSKDATPTELIRVVQTVGGGDSNFDLAATIQYLRHHAPAAPCALPVSGEPLTARERDVLLGVADGLTNAAIARRLGIGVRSVETYRERLMRKLGIRTVAGLTRYALAQGMEVGRADTAG